MGIIWTIIIGAIVGALAKFIMPGKDGGGFVMTTLLGIGGSVVATFLGRMIGWYQEGEGAQFIASTLGAILILWIYRMIKGKKAASA